MNFANSHHPDGEFITPATICPSIYTDGLSASVRSRGTPSGTSFFSQPADENEFTAHNWAEDTNRNHMLNSVNKKCRWFVVLMMGLTIASYFSFRWIFGE